MSKSNEDIVPLNWKVEFRDISVLPLSILQSVDRSMPILTRLGMTTPFIHRNLRPDLLMTGGLNIYSVVKNSYLQKHLFRKGNIDISQVGRQIVRDYEQRDYTFFSLLFIQQKVIWQVGLIFLEKILWDSRPLGLPVPTLFVSVYCNCPNIIHREWKI